MPISDQTVNEVVECVRDFLIRLSYGGVEVSGVVKKDGERDMVMVGIASDNPSLLIGQQGQNLGALQHLIRLVVRAQISDEVCVVIDVNDYKSKRVEYLKSMARDVALRVDESGAFEAMRPMSAYERRVVHMTLREYDEVETQSIGEGPDRRIVVRPAGTDEVTMDDVNRGSRVEREADVALV